MGFFKMLAVGTLGDKQDEKPEPKGRRLEPRIPCTSPDFKYVPAERTDLRKRFRKVK